MEIGRVLEALRSREVRYVAVGRLAAIAHGLAIELCDAEIVLELSAENLERLTAALGDLGESVELAPLTRGDQVRTRTLAMRPSAGDCEGFVELLEDAVERRVASVPLLAIEPYELRGLLVRTGEDPELFARIDSAMAAAAAEAEQAAAWITVDVLECSQIRTPAELFATYPELADAEALAASDERRIIEVRNVEPLIEAGHGEIVDRLARAGQTLEGSAVDLSVVRHREPPRGPLYQHESFTTRELEGREIDRAIAGLDEVLFVKPVGGHWQRIHLDAGLVLWAELSDQDVFDGFGADELRDLGLGGAQLGLVEARWLDGDAWVRVEVRGRGAIRIGAVDPGDLESDTVLSVVDDTG